MEKGRIRCIGRALGAAGLLVLALNLVDFYAGLDRIADISAVIGAMLTLGGAYLAMVK